MPRLWRVAGEHADYTTHIYSLGDEPVRKPRRSGPLTMHIHVGRTPRDLSMLNLGSGSTDRDLWMVLESIVRRLRETPSEAATGNPSLSPAGDDAASNAHDAGENSP